MARAKQATERGDMEAVQREMQFIMQTSMEDARAKLLWAKNRLTGQNR
jgi:hypothetical protein